MSTLTVSDHLYERLARSANQHGKSIEELLEQWIDVEMARVDAEQRSALFNRINARRESLYARYGEQPDSTLLVREDRDR